MGKFKDSVPQGNNVASFAEARQRQAERAARETMAQQVHPAYAADSPLGRAMEAAVGQALPPAPPDSVKPLTENTIVNPQVPQWKADDNG